MGYPLARVRMALVLVIIIITVVVLASGAKEWGLRGYYGTCAT